MIAPQLARTVVVAPLAGAVATLAFVERLWPDRWRSPHRKHPVPEGTGVSVVIPERANRSELATCLAALEPAAAAAGEPVEVLVVVNGTPASEYDALRREHPRHRWLFYPRPLGFQGAVREGVRAATRPWVYLLNSDMRLEPDALAAVLGWRAPDVFAVASQIRFVDGARRREETGWSRLRVVRGRVEVADVEPEEETVRGNVYASGGSSLFRRDLLLELVSRVDPYHPFYWEDAEWGVEAHRRGLDVLFCPASVAWHVHRGTIGKLYSPAEIDRVFERNRLLFQLRNLPGGARALAAVRRAPRRTVLEICAPRQVAGIVRSRLRALRAPHDVSALGQCTLARHYRPRTGDRPALVMVTPYCVDPPSHGGAVRLRALARQLATSFDVTLVSDEAALYPAGATVDGAIALHLSENRPARAAFLPAALARIEEHSHRGLSALVRRRALVDGASIVEVHFAELAGLVRGGKHGARWVLHLHDVPLRDPPHGLLDRLQRALAELHDTVVVCSPEDLGLLASPRATLVPNGVPAAWLDAYRPSGEGRTLLFSGPFRYPPNVEGVRAFVERVLPRVRAAVPGTTLEILGGEGAPRIARSLGWRADDGVVVHGWTSEPRRFLDSCALTVNPISGIRGSALKVIESLAAGRVCVTTADGARGFPAAGFKSLLTLERVDDFAEPIVRLLLDRPARNALERPDRSALAPFTWERAGRELTALYGAVGHGR